MSRHIKSIPPLGYKLMVLAAAVIWGLGVVVMKEAVGQVSPAYLLGIRFMLTALILAVVFRKRLVKHFDRKHLVYGLVLGVMIYAAFYVQTIGLVFTTPGKNAFLTATYCVMVPFLFWAICRKKPTKYNIIAAFLCIAGVGLVSVQSSLTIGFGDALTLVGAVLFAVHMVFVAKWSEGADVLVLTVYQFLAGGVCGLAMGAGFETFPAVSVLTDPAFLANLAYLVIFSSCLALVFQNVALAHVQPAQVSLFLSLESVFGVAFSVLLYGEELTIKLLAGFLLIFGAIVVSEAFPLRRFEGAEKRQHRFNRHAWRRKVDRGDRIGEDTEPAVHRRGPAYPEPVRQNAAEID